MLSRVEGSASCQIDPDPVFDLITGSGSNHNQAKSFAILNEYTATTVLSRVAGSDPFPIDPDPGFDHVKGTRIHFSRYC